MKAIDEACQQGLSLAKACEIFQISERRVYRWRNLAAINQYTRKKPWSLHTHDTADQGGYYGGVLKRLSILANSTADSRC